MRLLLVPVRTTLLVVLSMLLVSVVIVRVRAQEPSGGGSPQATTNLVNAFTYQGRVSADGIPITETCDFQFSLFDAVSGGAQVGSTQTKTNVAVTNGAFATQLDFGSTAFNGQDRYLATSLRCPAGSGTYTEMPPRQPLTPAPYATFASQVPWSGITGMPEGFADGIDNDGGTGSSAFWSLSGNGSTNPATQFVGTTNNVALEFRVNNQRAFRLEPNPTSPSIIGGFSGNSVTAGVAGGTVAGGGTSGSPNRVTDSFGTVGGGSNNRAGNDDGDPGNNRFGTVAGGEGNNAVGFGSIGGGQNNNVTNFAGTVAGGSSNSADYYATVGGGFGNVASGGDATIGGGSNNVANAMESTVGGGFGNSSTAPYATIGGGGRSDPDDNSTGNSVTDAYGTVGGGGNNQAGDGAGATDDNAYATVGGGLNNTANGAFSSIGGGDGNTASLRATVSGGFSNQATVDSATVGGGYDNSADGDSSTIGGGWLNSTSGTVAVVGGGFGNSVTKDRGTIAGGSDNTISGDGEDATIGGGYDNTVTADSATVAGGWTNTASGTAAFVGGGYGNTASGVDSMVVGGFNNTASGNYSFASGTRAKADDFGAFVWGDGTETDVFSPGSNTFSVRASGGIWLGTNSSPSIGAGNFLNTSTGARLTTGGTWTNNSNVHMKENFNAVDTQSVLETLMSVPVTKWNYITEDEDTVRMGPMAQDFYAAFGLGDSETSIGTIDAQGVAFAAIQGLYETVQEENTELKSQLAALQGENAGMEERLARLESAAGFRSESSTSVPGWAWLAMGLAGGLAGVVVLRKR